MLDADHLDRTTVESAWRVCLDYGIHRCHTIKMDLILDERLVEHLDLSHQARLRAYIDALRARQDAKSHFEATRTWLDWTVDPLVVDRDVLQVITPYTLSAGLFCSPLASPESRPPQIWQDDALSHIGIDLEDPMFGDLLSILHDAGLGAQWQMES